MPKDDDSDLSQSPPERLGRGLIQEVEPREVHVMRHTAITKLIERGVDIATVQRISGHKTGTMVMRYTHVRSPHVNQAMKELARTLPAPSANATPTPVTPKLHIVGGGSV